MECRSSQAAIHALDSLISATGTFDSDSLCLRNQENINLLQHVRETCHQLNLDCVEGSKKFESEICTEFIDLLEKTNVTVNTSEVCEFLPALQAWRDHVSRSKTSSKKLINQSVQSFGSLTPESWLTVIDEINKKSSVIAFYASGEYTWTVEAPAFLSFEKKLDGTYPTFNEFKKSNEKYANFMLENLMGQFSDSPIDTTRVSNALRSLVTSFNQSRLEVVLQRLWDDVVTPMLEKKMPTAEELNRLSSEWVERFPTMMSNELSHDDEIRLFVRALSYAQLLRDNKFISLEDYENKKPSQWKVASPLPVSPDMMAQSIKDAGDASGISFPLSVRQEYLANAAEFVTDLSGTVQSLFEEIENYSYSAPSGPYYRIRNSAEFLSVSNEDINRLKIRAWAVEDFNASEDCLISPCLVVRDNQEGHHEVELTNEMRNGSVQLVESDFSTILRETNCADNEEQIKDLVADAVEGVYKKMDIQRSRLLESQLDTHFNEIKKFSDFDFANLEKNQASRRAATPQFQLSSKTDFNKLFAFSPKVLEKRQCAFKRLLESKEERDPETVALIAQQEATLLKRLPTDTLAHVLSPLEVKILQNPSQAFEDIARSTAKNVNAPSFPKRLEPMELHSSISAHLTDMIFKRMTNDASKLAFNQEIFEMLKQEFFHFDGSNFNPQFFIEIMEDNEKDFSQETFQNKFLLELIWRETGSLMLTTQPLNIKDELDQQALLIQSITDRLAKRQPKVFLKKRVANDLLGNDTAKLEVDEVQPLLMRLIIKMRTAFLTILKKHIDRIPDETLASMSVDVSKIFTPLNKTVNKIQTCKQGANRFVDCLKKKTWTKDSQIGDVTACSWIQFNTLRDCVQIPKNLHSLLNAVLSDLTPSNGYALHETFKWSFSALELRTYTSFINQNFLRAHLDNLPELKEDNDEKKDDEDEEVDPAMFRVENIERF
eukprot:GDKJ01040685.1.p1 GENE.GDKJ01040685.1~~GDKJ01040685.1.p1  ORF type:complete len:944 (+),score=270.89 GDKJ01040685.1:37-2868(+)